MVDPTQEKPVLLVEFPKANGKFKAGQRVHARLAELENAGVTLDDIRLLGTCPAGTKSDLAQPAGTPDNPAPGIAPRTGTTKTSGGGSGAGGTSAPGGTSGGGK